MTGPQPELGEHLGTRRLATRRTGRRRVLNGNTWAALLAALVLATPIALLGGAPPASPAPVTDDYSYAAGGGTGTAPASGSGLDGTTITLATQSFTDPGYTFAGWNDGSFTYTAGATYLLASGGTPIIFTAQWTANATDTVTFNSEGGSGVAPQNGLDGTTITLPAAPTRAGYIFDGWFTAASGGTALTSPYALSGSVTLYAQWTAAPTASLLVPSKGATLSGSTYLDASAYNATSVEFLLFGGTYGFAAPVICTATPTPYGWVCAWNTTTVPNGSYALVAEASNSTGSAFSSGDSITVDNPLPTASVLIPSTGATLLGSNYLDAAAYNATTVEFLLFGGTYGFAAPVICTATPTVIGWLCSWNTTTVPNGSYALVAETFNSAGSAFSSGVSITVDNPLMGYTGNPTGARIALDGDSITALSASDLQATLEPTYQINLYDQAGWRIAQVAPAVTIQVTSTPPPDAVVINLGTNDVIQQTLTWQADYNSMFASVQNDPCVVLFNINRIIDNYNPNGTVTAEQINAYLASLASAHPNVHIIDWDAAVQANISLLTFDFIHPSPAGQQWIADQTKMALDSCSLPTYPSSSP